MQSLQHQRVADIKAALAEEIREKLVPVFRGDALGMELHARYRQRAMRKTHDDSVLGFRRYFEGRGEVLASDDERMIAGRRESIRYACKDTLAPMVYLAKLAVHRICAHHMATKCLPDGLMAEANAKDGHIASGRFDKLQAYSGLVRIAGTGRQDDTLWMLCKHRRRRDLVVAVNLDLCAKLAEIMIEVIGKTVVVIDQNKHAHIALAGLSGWYILNGR